MRETYSPQISDGGIGEKEAGRGGGEGKRGRVRTCIWGLAARKVCGHKLASRKSSGSLRKGEGDMQLFTCIREEKGTL